MAISTFWGGRHGPGDCEPGEEARSGWRNPGRRSRGKNGSTMEERGGAGGLCRGERSMQSVDGVVAFVALLRILQLGGARSGDEARERRECG
ncbi:hypothetical protein PR202_ga14580 [Eleusine coracana subsp. coracana]|uniref:Uncharacterized protein n=1 Tax=Eleusine coracana subsp. coracana TaxID=191504 RepID=A0AAV5CHQ1_ELECO|nr:hypothetical protein PR202_ga14580 [Eleusine coracana subsp. coracana]